MEPATGMILGSLISGGLAAGGSLLGGGSGDATEAAEIQAAAMGRAAQIQGESGKDAIAELQRQYAITTALLKPYTDLGPQAQASYLSMLAASPIPSQAQAAQNLIDQMGGRITSYRQEEIPQAERAATVGEPPPAWAGGSGWGSYDAYINALGEWNVAHGLPFNAGYDIATGEYGRMSGGLDAPQFRTVADYIDIPRMDPIVYEESPGYQFQLGEGLRAIEQGAAGRGKQLSGGTQMALQQYGQGLAAQDYDSFLNRYYQSLLPFTDMQATGVGAATQTGATGMGTAQSVANTLMNTGTNQANLTAQAGQYGANAALQSAQNRSTGYQNVANILANTTGNISSYYQLQNLLNPTSTAGAGGGGYSVYDIAYPGTA